MDEESEFLIDNLIDASILKSSINIELQLLGELRETDTPEWKATQKRYSEVSTVVNQIRKELLKRLENGTAER